MNRLFVFQNLRPFRTQRLFTLPEMTSSRSLYSSIHLPSEEDASDCFSPVCCSGVLAPCSWRSGPLRGSDPSQPHCPAEQEYLCWTERVCLLLSDTRQAIHCHRGNVERRLREQHLH